ncbi:hypothetical protein [Micromonospora avicenniae]|uniref:Uncharacterized protein n=1 Tax=Micromonospora avicenniae TaxID=1198245 RepID=A0A1N6QS44_9ACTN|nr:hypothetical protein [Micromonospora avicenniae]SIQ19407.1 hypothetical protein SAMN05444858_101456 [Micromonospora avicenniae]
MTTDEESDDIAPVTWTPVGDLPGHLPIDRLDYGDAEQLAEMTDTDEPVTEEPLEMVDAPIKVRAPYDRAHKRRNQRPLPT